MADNVGAAGGQGATGNNGTGTQGAQGAAGGSYVVQNGGGAGSAGGQGSAGAAGGGAYESRAAAAEGIVDRLVQRYGSPANALNVLSGELYDMREQRRQLDGELATLRTQLPPNGAMVLVGDDVAAFQTFKSLNVPAAEVKTRLDEHARLLTEKQSQAGQTLNQQAAAAAGYTAPDVLGDLLTARGLQLEMRDTMVTANGKTETKRMPFVRKASDANGHYSPLGDWVSGNAAAYIPALTAKPAQGAGGQQAAGNSGTSGQGAAGVNGATQGAGTQGGQQNVVVMGGQTAGTQDGTGAVDPVAARIAANRKAAAGVNPLRPTKAGA